MTAAALETAPAPSGHNKPPRAKPTFRRTCPECGEGFVTTTKDRLFCTDAHKAAFHNRSSKIGRSLVPLALAWRSGRNVKGKTPEARALRASAARAFSDMCRLLDEAAADDRAAERMTKLDYLRQRNALDGTLQASERAAFHREQDEKAARREKAAAKAAASAKP